MARFYVIDFARQQERVLLTLNRRHFIKLHETAPDHFGIIVCTFDPDFSGMAKRISEVFPQDESIAGKLVRVNRPTS